MASGAVIEGTASFHDRVRIWQNLFKLWRENPKHLVIGNGIGRTGSRIVEGTYEEHLGAVAVHNTYLQLLADFGIVGGVLMLAFFAIVAYHALQVFYARGGVHLPGGRALCGMVAAILITGMMESQPLGANTPMNMMLYYALAVLCAEGRAMKKA
jgi:O-antigen ligase